MNEESSSVFNVAILSWILDKVLYYKTEVQQITRYGTVKYNRGKIILCRMIEYDGIIWGDGPIPCNIFFCHVIVLRGEFLTLKVGTSEKGKVSHHLSLICAVDLIHLLMLNCKVAFYSNVRKAIGGRTHGIIVLLWCKSANSLMINVNLFSSVSWNPTSMDCVLSAEWLMMKSTMMVSKCFLWPPGPTPLLANILHF